MKNVKLNALLARAKAQMDNGEWAAARESCRAALVEDRNCSEAMYRLGEFHADARSPLVNVEKAVYWFDASHECSEVYTDPETGEDGWDRMSELFRRECCPDLDCDKMERGFLRAIELMQPTRNISTVDDAVRKVRDLFINMAAAAWQSGDDDTGQFLSDFGQFERFTPPLPMKYRTFDTTFMDRQSRKCYIGMMTELMSQTQLKNIVRGMLERGMGTFWMGSVMIMRPLVGAALEYCIGVSSDSESDMAGTYVFDAQGFEKILRGALDLQQSKIVQWRDKSLACCERMIETLTQKASETEGRTLFVRIARPDGTYVTDPSATAQWIASNTVYTWNHNNTYVMDALIKAIADIAPGALSTGFHYRLKQNIDTFDFVLGVGASENAFSFEQFVQILRDAQAGIVAKGADAVRRDERIFEAARPLLSDNPPHVFGRGGNR